MKFSFDKDVEELRKLIWSYIPSTDVGQNDFRKNKNKVTQNWYNILEEKSKDICCKSINLY